MARVGGDAMTYNVKIGFNWWTLAEGRKRKAGEPYKEQRAEPGDELTSKDLAGADVKALLTAEAIEDSS